MSQEDTVLYVPKAFDLREPRAIRRANLIIECSQRDPSSLHDAVPAAAALDASKLAASYTPLNVYAWILPVLGFIGTASGMASSIGGVRPPPPTPPSRHPSTPNNQGATGAPAATT